MVFALAAAGFACIAYGTSVMLIWSGTSFFAVWMAIGTIFLCSAFAVHSGWWEALPIVLRRTLECLGCMALALCVITQGLALSCFDDRGEENLDWIVVLGAQVRDTGPSVVLRERLDAAYDYLVENPSTHCIVSGGQGANEPDAEAHVMERYLVDRGIGSERIVIEDQSSNTSQNIRNSMRFLDPNKDRVGIVTNNFHVFRGKGIARKLGIAHVWGIAAPSTPWYLPNNLLRETFGIVKDFLTGNL